jgi:hypothetical protein
MLAVIKIGYVIPVAIFLTALFSKGTSLYSQATNGSVFSFGRIGFGTNRSSPLIQKFFYTSLIYLNGIKLPSYLAI